MTTPHDAHDRPPPTASAGPAHLLRTQRFLPLLVTQTLGALNDNLFKNALVVLALFQAAEHGGPVLVALSGGVFILPYVALSALAGQLADHGEKSRRKSARIRRRLSHEGLRLREVEDLTLEPWRIRGFNCRPFRLSSCLRTGPR